MITINYSKRNRKATRDGVRAGTHTLRVIGSQKTGFRLGGEKNGIIRVFGQHFTKQTDAVAYGVKKFGIKAVKVVQSKPKAKASQAA